MYAIIRDRGSQYKVSPGDVVQIDLRESKDGESITFDEVLLTSNGEGAVKVGEPRVSGAKVSATVVKATFKGDKIDVVHFRRRQDSMDKVGHRQKYTHVKIDGIEGA